MFAGDLHQGLDHIVSPLFEGETRQLLDKVHVEARLLFGVYIGFVSAPPCAAHDLESRSYSCRTSFFFVELLKRKKASDSSCGLCSYCKCSTRLSSCGPFTQLAW
eukprot:3722912-Rhodomonas_salina.3